MIYYIAFNISNGKHEIRTASKYTSKTQTGTLRFKTRYEAQLKLNQLNN